MDTGLRLWAACCSLAVASRRVLHRAIRPRSPTGEYSKAFPLHPPSRTTPVHCRRRAHRGAHILPAPRWRGNCSDDETDVRARPASARARGGRSRRGWDRRHAPTTHGVERSALTAPIRKDPGEFMLEQIAQHVPGHVVIPDAVARPAAQGLALGYGVAFGVLGGVLIGRPRDIVVPGVALGRAGATKRELYGCGCVLWIAPLGVVQPSPGVYR